MQTKQLIKLVEDNITLRMLTRKLISPTPSPIQLHRLAGVDFHCLLSGDESTLVVGVPHANRFGCMFVFHWSGSNFVHHSTIDRPTPADEHFVLFGENFRVSNDGNTIVVIPTTGPIRTLGDDEVPDRNFKAYVGVVFRRSANGYEDTHLYGLVEHLTNATFDLAQIAISDNKSRIAVSFPSKGFYSGKVIVFSSYGKPLTIQPIFQADDRYFGSLMSFSSDGNLLAITSPVHDPTIPEAGSVSIYAFQEPRLAIGRDHSATCVYHHVDMKPPYQHDVFGGHQLEFVNEDGPCFIVLKQCANLAMVTYVLKELPGGGWINYID